MESKTFCQSCSMPLESNEMFGTEKDGSLNHEYCKYCYRDGVFINPGITLDEMRSIVKTQMGKMKLDNELINTVEASLPGLNRWRKQKVSA